MVRRLGRPEAALSRPDMRACRHTARRGGRAVRPRYPLQAHAPATTNLHKRQPLRRRYPTPPLPSRPRLPLLRCEALTRSAADNMRSSGSAPPPAARCSVACCTLQRCVLHVAALQRCMVAPHRLGAGLTQATAKRLAIEISQRGRVVSSFLLPWHQIGWIDAQTKRQARTTSV